MPLMEASVSVKALLKMTDDEIRLELSLQFRDAVNDLMDRLKQSDNWREVEDE